MNNIKSALQSLKSNKARLALTILELAVGVIAIVVVLSTSQSIQQMVLSQLETFGSDVIQVEVKVPNTGHTSIQNVSSMVQGVTITSLKHSDAESIMRQMPEIESFYAGMLDQRVVGYREQTKKTLIFAEDAAAQNMDKTEVANGRFFTEEENSGLAKVVVLASNIAKELFNEENPVGNFVKIEKENYLVVGVMASRGSMMGMDYDSIIYMPIKTLQKRVLGIDYVSFIMFKTKDVDKAEQTAVEMAAIVRERHNISDPAMDDFAVTTMAKAAEMINTIFGGVTLLILALVSISLLVGGIGVMNVMYISVSERTFEIGLRKAIGAKKTDILWQFLWESLAISVLGGVAGLIFGIGIAYGVSYVAVLNGFSDWKFFMPVSAYVISVIFSVGTGIVFGMYPARKAANLDPIEALRQE